MFFHYVAVISSWEIMNAALHLKKLEPPPPLTPFESRLLNKCWLKMTQWFL